MVKNYFYDFICIMEKNHGNIPKEIKNSTKLHSFKIISLD